MIRKLYKARTKKANAAKQLPVRITNDTVAEHRERILAGGRKHKYPLQYTKHRLIWNTVIISAIVLFLAGLLVWLQLYVWRDTGDIAYRITRFLPLPAGKVDGEAVRYSDYLLYHRSTMAIQESQGRVDTAADKAAFQRQQAMTRAVEDAYVRKLARERDLRVGRDQVVAAIEQKRQESGLSAQGYEDVVRQHLGWSMDELREVMQAALLRQAVAFSVDQTAADTSATVSSLLGKGKGLEAIAEELGQKVQFVAPETVGKDNADGGLSLAASALKPGQVSGATKTLAGDGYYFIRLHSSDATSVTYSYIRVPLTTLQEMVGSLKNDGKIHYYVKVEG